MGEQTETYQRTCQKGPSARFQRPLPTRSGHSAPTKGWLARTQETIARLWADPEHFARISAQIKAR